jgi:hypothetical protein
MASISRGGVNMGRAVGDFTHEAIANLSFGVSGRTQPEATAQCAATIMNINNNLVAMIAPAGGSRASNSETHGKYFSGQGLLLSWCCSYI